MINRFLIALSFLTVLPLKAEKINEKNIAGSVIFFPFVGLLEGAVSVLLIKGLNYIFSSAVISIILLLFLFSLRGIFHIDGVSDTFDALFYRETGQKEKDIQRRLEIMKDSTVGVAGVVVSVFDILCRFVFFKELIEINQFMTLIFIFTFSRWSVIPLMYYGKPAKNTGLGAIFIGKINKGQFILSSSLPSFLLIYFTLKIFIFLPLVVFILCILLIILKKFFQTKFNGITGDHLGATVEITEIVFILCFLLSVRWLSY
ncbi:adenosylcobinamide-GDP ribazoletransferase [Thermodesulfovibrio sp. 3907-1M]|uniref:Adenosylcobinamide-GDP ribazoletransferase n=1 Tax=Thermodesulfovibrio autotrophicus TaxID=3118333 RepID=A0AAU8GYG3_9BACT